MDNDSTGQCERDRLLGDPQEWESPNDNKVARGPASRDPRSTLYIQFFKTKSNWVKIKKYFYTVRNSLLSFKL